MTWRQKQKLWYGFIFALVVLALLYPLYLTVKPAPTCFDRKLNQNEEEVDCGGACLSCSIFKLQNVKTYTTSYFVYADNSLDMVAEVENPNDGWGLREFSYQFIIQGTGGEQAIISGNSFIYPRQRKYVTALNRQLPAFPIKNIILSASSRRENWSEIGVDPVKVNLLNYSFGNNALSAEIINAADKTYAPLTLRFVIFDASDTMVGVVESTLSSLEPLQRQTIRLSLPPFQESPASVIFEADSNVFEGNF